MNVQKTYYIKKQQIYIVPILHYTMEFACEVRRVFDEIHPDCVAVELPESMQKEFHQAASRLPSLSVITSYHPQSNERLCYLAEPCDASFEALRSALDSQIPSYCIDLDVLGYPEIHDIVPDPYAVAHIGCKDYYEAFNGCSRADKIIKSELDVKREGHMARRLKELSYSYDTILAVIGMTHVPALLTHLDDQKFIVYEHATRVDVSVHALTEETARNITAECGWIVKSFEEWREFATKESPLLDRQKCYYDLLKQATIPYALEMKSDFPSWGIATIFRFCRNWAHLRSQLLPDLFQLLTSAKACMDHNFAYEVWKLATEYPCLKNIDNLPEIDLSISDVWGSTKKILFYLKKPSEKSRYEKRLAKEKGKISFPPPNPFAICSYPPEDSIIEDFGEFLKKKALGQQLEESARVIPFSTSLEDGIDTKETIRHWSEKKLYVRSPGKPPQLVGSCVVIFDEDTPTQGKPEQYTWKLTWLGEHEQESDMAFYATDISKNVVGPGISKCEHGGFMLTYPPRRVFDVWHDPDYSELSTKPEVLLAAAIDYAVRPVIVYVAHSPPSQLLKNYAARRGRRIHYIPLSQFSPLALKKIRTFHVLDGFETRKIADDYIM